MRYRKQTWSRTYLQQPAAHQHRMDSAEYALTTMNCYQKEPINALNTSKHGCLRSRFTTNQLTHCSMPNAPASLSHTLQSVTPPSLASDPPRKSNPTLDIRIHERDPQDWSTPATLRTCHVESSCNTHVVYARQTP